MVLFTITGEFPLAFRCSPVRASYDPTVTERKCFSNDVMFALAIYQAVVMFITNFIICALPIIPLWRLKLSLRKRIALLTICVLGEFKRQNQHNSHTQASMAKHCWFYIGIGVTVASLVRFVLLSFSRDQTDLTCTYWSELRCCNVH